jgi:hypothetical protein
MNSLESINASLYRKIRSGKEFEKYFSKAACKPTFLGDGDTRFTLDQMKQWILKYQHHTLKLSKVLKSNNKKTTIQNIWNFLYQHFQYNADGWEQNLRSPFCSWDQRKQGIDCKSYSIFASTLLLNLGIEHSLRRVTQPSSPNKWSHVYIIIPVNNTNLIIDGTTHTNLEVAFVQKDDLKMKMPHYGLAAAYEDTFIGTNETELAILNFIEITKEMQLLGVSKETVNDIVSELRLYVEAGKDPMVKLTETSITIEGKTFYFGDQLNGPQGLSVALIAATATKGLLTKAGIGKLFSGLSKPFSKLFGNLFGGSPPAAFAKSGKTFLNTIIPGIQEKNQNNVGLMLTEMSKAYNYMVLFYKAHLAGSNSSRTKQGNAQGMEFVQSFKPTLNQVINELSTTHNISTNIIQTTFNKNFHPSIKPHSGSHVGSYTQYTLSQKGSGVVNTNGNILPGGNNTNQPINQNQPTIQKASYTIPAAILGTAIVAGILLNKKQGKK